MSDKLNELIYSFNVRNIKPGLSRILKLMSHYSVPHKSYPCILVGGTNGKGSIANFLSSIFTKHNLKTGLYTSPHLIKVNWISLFLYQPCPYLHNQFFLQYF